MKQVWKLHKAIVFSIVMVFCLFLVGCNKDADKNQEVSLLKEYLNFEENTLYHYTGEDGVYSNWTVFYEYIKEDKIQRRLVIADKEQIEVLRLSEDKLELYAGFSSTSHADFTGLPSNNYGLILKNPLEVGSKWGFAENDEGQIETEIIGIDVEVTVPYGTFETLAVKTTYKYDNYTITQYYAKGVGLVKTETEFEGKTVVSALSNVEKEKSLDSQLAVFYADKGEISYFAKEISYHTNEDLVALYNKAIVEAIQTKTGKDISKQFKINSFTTDPENLKMVVDLSTGIVDLVNEGKTEEEQTLIFQSYINTFCYLGHSNSVCVTVDGEAFSSEFINKAIDEYTEVVVIELAEQQE